MKQSFQYYFLSLLSFLLYFIGIVGMRLLTIIIGIVIGTKLEKYIGDFEVTVAWIISIFLFGLVLIGLEYIYPYLEQLDDCAEGYKKRPYTEKYGRNYPQPKADDFAISREEFNEYNSRFQFEFVKIIFTHGLWIAALIYTIYAKLYGSGAIYFLGTSAIVAIVLNYLFDYWNQSISQKHRYYEKINKYQSAVKIYHKILRENLFS